MLALVTNSDERCRSGEEGGSLGPMYMIALLLAVAIIGAISGFIASAAVLRKRRRARRYFVLGLLCGLTTGAMLRRRRRAIGRLVTIAPCTIRLRHLAAAGTDLFHDAKSSSTFLLHRFYSGWAPELRRSTHR